MEPEVDWNATARVLRLTTYYRDDDYVTEYYGNRKCPASNFAFRQ